jgi:hypothetical protein
VPVSYGCAVGLHLSQIDEADERPVGAADRDGARPANRTNKEPIWTLCPDLTTHRDRWNDRQCYVIGIDQASELTVIAVRPKSAGSVAAI